MYVHTGILLSIHPSIHSIRPGIYSFIRLSIRCFIRLPLIPQTLSLENIYVQFVQWMKALICLNSSPFVFGIDYFRPWPHNDTSWTTYWVSKCTDLPPWHLEDTKLQSGSKVVQASADIHMMKEGTTRRRVNNYMIGVWRLKS